MDEDFYRLFVKAQSLNEREKILFQSGIKKLLVQQVFEKQTKMMTKKASKKAK
jgi:hypothetical protein